VQVEGETAEQGAGIGLRGRFETDLGKAMAPLFGYLPVTPLQNATGQPAISLPLAMSKAGLPIGMHFAGRFGDETTLLRLAGQLEKASPWAVRHPAIWN
jgi:Asp-tRNA(Asn)/Glu-tRNA(Gln) amidotransferase A subunit family amidase